MRVAQSLDGKPSNGVSALPRRPHHNAAKPEGNLYAAVERTDVRGGDRAARPARQADSGASAAGGARPRHRRQQRLGAVPVPSIGNLLVAAFTGKGGLGFFPSNREIIPSGSAKPLGGWSRRAPPAAAA